MYLEKRRSSPVFHCLKRGFAPPPLTRENWQQVKCIFVNIQYDAFNDDVDVDAKGDSDDDDYES